MQQYIAVYSGTQHIVYSKYAAGYSKYTAVYRVYLPVVWNMFWGTFSIQPPFWQRYEWLQKNGINQLQWTVFTPTKMWGTVQGWVGGLFLFRGPEIYRKWWKVGSKTSLKKTPFGVFGGTTQLCFCDTTVHKCSIRGQGRWFFGRRVVLLVLIGFGRDHGKGHYGQFLVPMWVCFV